MLPGGAVTKGMSATEKATAMANSAKTAKTAHTLLPTIFGGEAAINGYDSSKAEGASTGKAILYGAGKGLITYGGLKYAGSLFQSPSTSLGVQVGLRGTEALAGGTVQTLAENTVGKVLYGKKGSLWDGWAENVSMWAMMNAMALPHAQMEARARVEQDRIESDITEHGIEDVSRKVTEEFIKAKEAHETNPTKETQRELSRTIIRMSSLDPYIQAFQEEHPETQTQQEVPNANGQGQVQEGNQPEHPGSGPLSETEGNFRQPEGLDQKTDAIDNRGVLPEGGEVQKEEVAPPTAPVAAPVEPILPRA